MTEQTDANTRDMTEDEKAWAQMLVGYVADKSEPRGIKELHAGGIGSTDHQVFRWELTCTFFPSQPNVTHGDNNQ